MPRTTTAPDDVEPSKLPKLPEMPWERRDSLGRIFCRDGNGSATVTYLYMIANRAARHECKVCKKVSYKNDDNYYCFNCRFCVCKDCVEGLDNGGNHDDVNTAATGPGYFGLEGTVGYDLSSDEESVN